MSVRVRHTIHDLARDAGQVVIKASEDCAAIVRDDARKGNGIARAFARESAGAHGKHYADRFSAEMITPFIWEYGPEGRPQGEMSFEFGSRNQPPHLDLAKSADIIGPQFADDVGDAARSWFW